MGSLRAVLILWRQVATTLLDRGPKYGIPFSHDIARFYLFLRTRIEESVKNTFPKS